MCVIFSQFALVRRFRETSEPAYTFHIAPFFAVLACIVSMLTVCGSLSASRQMSGAGTAGTGVRGKRGSNMEFHAENRARQVSKAGRGGVL